MVATIPSTPTKVEFYNIFTIASGVQAGAVVQSKRLANGDVIPVIAVGEEGRGRKLSFIPITLQAESLAEFKAGKTVRVLVVGLGKTLKGGHKFIQASDSTPVSPKSVILVMPTKIGYRGGNNHTGDINPSAGEDDSTYLPFPGEELAKGMIAQGCAGNMGSGYQHIRLMPVGSIFRTRYNGRLYGAPDQHFYYVQSVNKIDCATGEERDFMEWDVPALLAS